MGLFDKIFGKTTPRYFTEFCLTGLRNDLDADEQRALTEYYQKDILGSIDIYQDSPLKTTQSKSSFLTNIVAAYSYKKMYRSADKVVKYIEGNYLDCFNVVDKHFFYNACIELYYKPQSDEFNQVEKAIYYCYSDIELVKTNLKEIRKLGNGKLPFIPPFKQLTIILEKQEKFDDAVKICDMAIKLGLNDKTQKGYSGRKEKLKNKEIKKERLSKDVLFLLMKKEK